MVYSSLQIGLSHRYRSSARYSKKIIVMRKMDLQEFVEYEKQCVKSQTIIKRNSQNLLLVRLLVKNTNKGLGASTSPLGVEAST